MKKQIFSTAWQLFREGAFTEFRAALKAAWAKFRLQLALRSGLAYFRFKKSDGEIRQAIGTLNGQNFSYSAKGSERHESAAVVKFWDVEKRAWRSLRIETFLGFI